MKRGREFKSRLDHHSVHPFLHFLENRSKSARMRAICDCAWTQRTSLAALFAGIKRKLSARDFVRSICKTVGMENLPARGASASDPKWGVRREPFARTWLRAVARIAREVSNNKRSSEGVTAAQLVSGAEEQRPILRQLDVRDTFVFSPFIGHLLPLEQWGEITSR